MLARPVACNWWFCWHRAARRHNRSAFGASRREDRAIRGSPRRHAPLERRGPPRKNLAERFCAAGSSGLVTQQNSALLKAVLISRRCGQRTRLEDRGGGKSVLSRCDSRMSRLRSAIQASGVAPVERRNSARKCPCGFRRRATGHVLAPAMRSAVVKSFEDQTGLADHGFESPRTLRVHDGWPPGRDAARYAAQRPAENRP